MRRGEKSNSIIAVVLGVVVLCGAARADLTDGLISRWTFDEGTGDTAYDSAGSNDGTIYGATWTTGQIGGALNFDGIDDYVDVGDQDSLDFEANESFSISVWFKLLQDVSGGSAPSILDKRKWKDAPVYGYYKEGYSLIVYQNKLGFGLEDVSNNSAGITGSTQVNDDKWHHVIVIRDTASDKLYMYLDGISDAIPITDSTVGSLETSWPFNIAKRKSAGPGPDYFYFPGPIDDVRVYNRVLFAEEVEELYQSGLWNLVGLEIFGPNEVAEDFSAQYKAIAHYDNGGTADVTDSAEWSVDDEIIAGINAGLLTTEAIDLPQDIVITAEYSEGENTQEAEKQVSIFAICPSGSALDFDGLDDYVDCGNDESLNITDEITMVAWVKPSDSSGSEFIAAKWHNQAIDSSYGLRLADLNPRFFLANNTQDTTKTFTDLVINDNAWNHIVATWDGSIMKAYLNGILSDQTELFIGPINSTTNPLAIGYNPGGNGGIGGDYLNGTIDEVSIWNRALSAGEIQILMHTKPEAGEPNLVAYWDFDEGEGEITGDLSGNGNDGTLVGAEWVPSDAPVGICSVEGIVERNLLNVLGMKNDVLDILNEAIGKEEALWEYMDIMFKDRNFGNTSKGDVAKAKQKIHSAIEHEEQASTAVDKSIEKLDDALDALDIE